MSNAKAQEYRLKKTLESLPNVEVVHYYGSRNKLAGDFLIRVRPRLIRIDHKSTIQMDRIPIQRDWMPKLHQICLDRRHKEGASIGIITLSILRCRAIYAMTYIYSTMHRVVGEVTIKKGSKSLLLKGDLLELAGDGHYVKDGQIRVNFEDYAAYVWPLKDLLWFLWLNSNIQV